MLQKIWCKPDPSVTKYWSIWLTSVSLFSNQERQQQVENLAPVKNYISECLDKLQNAMKDKSIKVVAQRLEAITRKVG